MINTVNTVKAILQDNFKFSKTDSERWATALVTSHLHGGRLHTHLNVSAQKCTNDAKKYFPDKKSNCKVLLYVLGANSLKLCKYCQTIKSLSEFTGSSCKTCHSVQQKQYYNKYPEAQSQRARKRDRNLDRPLTQDEINIVFTRDQFRCKYCGYTNDNHNIDYGMNLHLDHVTPVSRGGLTNIENIQLLCIKCNSSKHNRLVS